MSSAGISLFKEFIIFQSGSYISRHISGRIEGKSHHLQTLSVSFVMFFSMVSLKLASKIQSSSAQLATPARGYVDFARGFRCTDG
jgi:hypothetical protein